MNNLELFMNMVKSMEGLDVSFKIGKESELIIKGDFMEMINAVGTVFEAQARSNEASRKIQELENNILK